MTRSRRCRAITSILLATPGIALSVRADHDGSGLEDSGERALALLTEVLRINRQEPTLIAKFVRKAWNDGKQTQFEGSLKLKRPNLAYIETKGHSTVASDGKTLWIHFTESNKYLKLAVNPTGRNISLSSGFLLPDVFAPDLARTFLSQDPTSLLPRNHRIEKLTTSIVDGREYRVIEGLYEAKMGLVLGLMTGAHRRRFRLFVGPDLLIEGCSSEVMTKSHAFAKSHEMRSETWLKDIKLGVPLDEAQFAYEPPANSTHLVDPASRLLSAGKPAPDFALPTPARGRLRLSEVLSQKRAVLLLFWYGQSERFRDELPRIQRMYAESNRQNVEFVAINRGDSAQQITQYAEKAGLTFPIAMGGVRGKPNYAIFGRYGVVAYPTYYLLDNLGKVVWRGVDFAEHELRAELEKLGVK